jgi:hypothetical protein
VLKLNTFAVTLLIAVWGSITLKARSFTVILLRTFPLIKALKLMLLAINLVKYADDPRTAQVEQAIVLVEDIVIGAVPVNAVRAILLVEEMVMPVPPVRGAKAMLLVEEIIMPVPAVREVRVMVLVEETVIPVPAVSPKRAMALAEETEMPVPAVIEGTPVVEIPL